MFRFIACRLLPLPFEIREDTKPIASREQIGSFHRKSIFLSDIITSNVQENS